MVLRRVCIKGGQERMTARRISPLVTSNTMTKKDRDETMTMHNSPQKRPIEFLRWAWRNYRSDGDDEAADAK